jgi:WD40 repeat protein
LFFSWKNQKFIPIGLFLIMYCEIASVTKLFDSGIFNLTYDKYTKEILILTSSYLYITDKHLKVLSKFPTKFSKITPLENGKFLGFGRQHVYTFSFSNEELNIQKTLEDYSRGIFQYDNGNKILLVDNRTKNIANKVKKYDMDGFENDTPLSEISIYTIFNMNLSNIEDRYYGYCTVDRYIIRDIQSDDIVKEMWYSVSCFLSLPLKHQFIVGTEQGSVQVYDTESWEYKTVLNNFDRILGLINLPGDYIAVAESYGVICVIDMNSLKVVCNFGSYQESSVQCFINLDDTYIISGDNEGLVTMWSTPNYAGKIFQLIFKNRKIPDIQFKFNE